MRYTAIVFLLLFSCAPFQRSANSHLKLAERHLSKAKMKGAVINETIETETDTADVKEAAVKKEFQATDIDTVYLQSNCDSLKSKNPETKSAAIAKIQEEVCPDVEETMVLQIPVTVNDSTYYIDVSAAVRAHGGKLSIGLQNKPMAITYVSKTVKREIKPDKSKDIHKYGLGALVMAILFLIALAFRR